jgi:hypothetical protein
MPGLQNSPWTTSYLIVLADRLWEKLKHNVSSSGHTLALKSMTTLLGFAVRHIPPTNDSDEACNILNLCIQSCHQDLCFDFLDRIQKAKPETECWDQASWGKLINYVHERRELMVTSTIATEAITSIITNLLNAMIKRNTRHTYSSIPFDALELCIKTSSTESYATFLQHVFNSEEDRKPEQAFLTLIPKLAGFLKAHNVSCSSDPYASTFKDVTLGWLSEVLGHKPSADIYGSICTETYIYCSCDDCSQMVAFLSSKGKKTRTFWRIGSKRLKHIESQIRKRLLQRETVCQTVTRTSPQSLEACTLFVTKHTLMLISPIRFPKQIAHQNCTSGRNFELGVSRRLTALALRKRSCGIYSEMSTGF